MSDVVFVDTNILVYAHDADAGVKRERAIEAQKPQTPRVLLACPDVWRQRVSASIKRIVAD